MPQTTRKVAMALCSSTLAFRSPAKPMTSGVLTSSAGHGRSIRLDPVSLEAGPLLPFPRTRFSALAASMATLRREDKSTICHSQLIPWQTSVAREKVNSR